MIHRLHQQDAPEMLARGIPRGAPIAVLDVGAHTGGFAARVLEIFHAAVVHAFEPAPGPLAALRHRATADPRIRPVPAAVGEAEGLIVLHETDNPLLTSVLAPSVRSGEVSEGAARVVGKVESPVLTLDAWAGREGVGEVALIKLDVQGYELAALRGGRGLLARTSAVFAEAHVEPLYDGAATFSEIDLFLRDAGFVLHQIHDVTTQGDDLQTTQLDALWLKPDLLGRIRREPLERVTPPWAAAFLAALDRCQRLGVTRVALYGAGTHTRSIAPWLDAHPTVAVAAILDDRAELHGSTLAGRPVLPPAGLASAGAGAVVLSSDSFEDDLWARAAGFRQAGVPVLRLYGRETI